MTWVVPVEPYPDASRGVAVAGGVDQPHVRNGVVVADGVGAFAVVAGWAVASAARARRKLWVRPLECDVRSYQKS